MRNPTRRYAEKGDEKPRNFRVGDLFTWSNGETAIVTEVFDCYNGESRYGPEWTLRFVWTPGKDGDTKNKCNLDNPVHGTMRSNAFNQLCIGRGSLFFGRKESK
jgi:hypothetical protein